MAPQPGIEPMSMAVKTCVLTTEPPRKSPASHLALPLSESMFVLSQGHLLCACVRASLAAAAKLLLSCPTLCDPKDGSPPGSPVPGILQARTLEWVAFPSSMHESEVAQSCLTLKQRHGLQPTRLLRPWDFPGKSTGVGCHCLLQSGYQPCVNRIPIQGWREAINRLW